MQKNPQQVDVLREVTSTRYALLRSYRRDGTPVETPIWFGVQGNSVVFRTKAGPRTKRLAARPDAELTACDYRGSVRSDETTLRGREAILSGGEATEANRALHRRYGWQWNIVPMLKIPGVVNVHRHLSLREKLSRARDRNVWPDSAIVRIEFV